MSEAQARLEAERDKLKQAIAAQEALQDILPPEQLAEAQAVLRQKLQTVEASLSGGTGSIAQGPGAIAITATTGSTAIGRVEGNVYFGPEPDDPAEKLAIYCRVLCQSSGHLPL